MNISSHYFYCEFYDINHFKKQRNINVFVNSSVLYRCLYFVKFLEDDLKKIETYRRISGFYVILVRLLFAVQWHLPVGGE
jgi:hypothetical protein